MKRMTEALLLLLSFLVAFAITTIVTDYVCRNTGYYDEPTEQYQ